MSQGEGGGWELKLTHDLNFFLFHLVFDCRQVISNIYITLKQCDPPPQYKKINIF